MRIVVTAGPTREALDPVRFISNRSSGRMGYAIAAAAAKAGHEVVLITGPVNIPPPHGVEVVNIESADEMYRAVRRSIASCDAVVMAAAVADWKPAVKSAHKMKKGVASPVLRLRRTKDILKWVGEHSNGRLLVGFAAETKNMLAEAKRKLREKNLDLIVANNVAESGSGFDVDTNRVTLIYRSGLVDRWPMMLKTGLAVRLVKEIEKLKKAGSLL